MLYLLYIGYFQHNIFKIITILIDIVLKLLGDLVFFFLNGIRKKKNSKFFLIFSVRIVR